MKIVNNCIIFNAEEAAIITDALNEKINDTVMTLDQKRITDRASTDEKTRKYVLQMIKDLRAHSKLLGEIEDSGWWPKTAVHKRHYFKKDFREGLFSQFDDEGILKLFTEKNNKHDQEEKKE